VAPAPLTCRELVELVTEYLEGALDDAARARFEQHAAACRGCALYLHQMHETIRITRRLGEAGLRPKMRAGLLAAFPGWQAGG
jgi:anti-sigma factor RsiW